MKIHSNIITAADIQRAAQYASARGVYGEVFVDTCEQQGSRTRTRAWKVRLRGDGTVNRRRPNSGKGGGRFHCEEYAATWCQWGDFLASLYAIDPDMHCGRYYGNADDYHRRTGSAFTGSPMGECGMQACSSCRGTYAVHFDVRWAPVPQPTRTIPEEVTADRRAQRAQRREADQLYWARLAAERAGWEAQRAAQAAQREAEIAATRLAAAPTQRDMVAEIERTIDAYERAHPGARAQVDHPTRGQHIDNPADDPCGYRFIDDTAPTSLDEVLDDPLLDDEVAFHYGHFSLGGTWFCDTCNSPYCELA